jgi:hypothetical protein
MIKKGSAKVLDYSAPLNDTVQFRFHPGKLLGHISLSRIPFIPLPQSGMMNCMRVVDRAFTTFSISFSNFALLRFQLVKSAANRRQ